MQIVFQDPNSALNPKMSIHDSMSEGLINRASSKRSGLKRIKELLELVGISYSYRNSLSPRILRRPKTAYRRRQGVTMELTSWSWTSRYPIWTFRSKPR
jgi:ABC-type glutathione transport system ATPase component